MTAENQDALTEPIILGRAVDPDELATTSIWLVF